MGYLWDGTRLETLSGSLGVEARKLRPCVGEQLPVMFLRNAVSDHALEAGYLVFDGSAANVNRPVPIRIHDVRRY